MAQMIPGRKGMAGSMGGPNHPFVFWGSCFLWLTSLFAITWSLVLFFCLGDMLLITGTDIVIAFILLSGLIMLPTNVYMLYNIANGQKINHKGKVLCCPLWMLIVWIIVINCLGMGLCIQRICLVNTMNFILNSMKNYRNVPKYKRFMDNLQWSLKCCGIDSYKDWFRYDWYEKNRDYELGPSKINREQRKDLTVTDSVPLSCCKSGTCVPNYLLELGTHSINTKGCNDSIYRIYMATMNVHLIIFFLIVIAEIIVLTCIIGASEQSNESTRKHNMNVNHLMAVNNNFEESSSSDSICQEYSDVELKLYKSEEPLHH